MGQFWTVFNIDAREHYSSSGWKLGEWFFQDDHDKLADLLRDKAPMSMPEEIKKKLTDGKRAVQTSTLFKLPAELWNMVLQELRGDDVLFCLAITCKTIFAIAEKHLVKFYEELFPSWRDCRIICLGEYIDDEDELPAGVLTEGEIEWVKSEREKWGSCYSIFTETFKNERFQRLKVFHSAVGLDAMWRRSAWGPHGYTAWEGAYEDDMDMLRALYTHDQVSATSRVDREVLCNVSKRQYVRDVGYIDPEVPMCVTLAHALIVLICWSPWSDYALAYDRDLEAVRDMKRGRWAGDRFRIVTEDALANMEDKAEWTDVTEEAAVILRHLSKKNRSDWDWALEYMRNAGCSWPESESSSSDSASCSGSDSESSSSDTNSEL
ncbi:hypothetical protein GY45DRAFT_850329 [Cubamyces sp. BRFM 1775]|nr:hypothetical protein GY45DRAFT_850329 [Cubamyces sp. BRFM 1775]